MSFVYKNITKSVQLLTLASQQRNSISHIPLGIGSVIELSYPGLDLYLPHILARIDEGGNDITHIVLRQNEEAKKIITPVPDTSSLVSSVKPKMSPSPSVSGSTNPTAVKPAIYVDNTPKPSKTKTVEPVVVAEILKANVEQQAAIETPSEKSSEVAKSK